MAKLIRSPTIATANWKSRASAASSFYGTQAEAADWKTYAGNDASEKNFNTSMTKVLSAKTRQLGVGSSSNEIYHAGISSVGVSRFSDGVDKSEPRMNAVMNKLIPAEDTLRKSLPTRGVRGSSDNKNRMTGWFDGLAAQKGKFKAVGVARKA